MNVLHRITLYFLILCFLVSCQSSKSNLPYAQFPPLPIAPSKVRVTPSAAPLQTLTVSTTEATATNASKTEVPQPMTTLPGESTFNPGWLVLPINNQLIAVNMTGDQSRILTPQPIDLVGPVNASPPGHGAFVAFLTGKEQEGVFQNLQLKILKVPSGDVVKEIPLMRESIVPNPNDGTYRYYNLLFAILERSNLAWSPDGRYLAFVAALDQPNADIYLYNIENNQIQRVSDEPQQPGNLSWSPDGKWLLYEEVENFGAGAGWTVSALQALETDHWNAKKIMDTEALTYLGWMDSETLLAQSYNFCFPTGGTKASGLMAIKPSTGEIRSILPSNPFPQGTFAQSQYISGSHWIAMSVQYPSETFVLNLFGINFGRKNPNESELFIVPLEGDRPASLRVGTPDAPVRIACSSATQACYAKWDHQIFSFSDKELLHTFETEGELPVPSPEGNLLAFFQGGPPSPDSKVGLRIYSTNPPENLVHLDVPVSGLVWRPDGQAVFYVSNETLYTLPVNATSSIPVHAKVPDDLLGKNFSMQNWVLP